MKTVEIMENYPPSKPFTDYKKYYSFVRKTLVKLNIPIVKAEFDEAGNCRTCGEAGNCPGWHTYDEVREALKREIRITRWWKNTLNLKE